MAKKKKSKSKRSRKATDAEGKGAHEEEEDYLVTCLNQIAKDERAGIELVPTDPTKEDPLFAELCPLLSPEEQKHIRDCGAFGEVKLKSPQLNDITEIYCLQRCCESGGSPAPPVPVFGGDQARTNSTKITLGEELRHLSTILTPAEMKWFVGEMVCDLLEGVPVTHTDISDAVIASIVPSTAQRLALQADAQYKYTTAQFLQVYCKLRHVVLEHKIMLAGAKADATFLVASDVPIPKLEPEEDKTPVSAVDALLEWDNLLDLLPRFADLEDEIYEEVEEDDEEDAEEAGA